MPILRREHLDAIKAHAEREQPRECCGILVGRAAEGAGEARVETVIAAPNVAEGDRRRRYAIEPRALLDAHKGARQRGYEVVGYYHSHPEGQARPSVFDREQAWPGSSYLIVALEAGRAVAVRSWRLAGDGFAEEAVTEEPVPREIT